MIRWEDAYVVSTKGADYIFASKEAATAAATILDGSVQTLQSIVDELVSGRTALERYELQRAKAEIDATARSLKESYTTNVVTWTSNNTGSAI